VGQVEGEGQGGTGGGIRVALSTAPLRVICMPTVEAVCLISSRRRRLVSCAPGWLLTPVTTRRSLTAGESRRYGYLWANLPRWLQYQLPRSHFPCAPPLPPPLGRV
jgi:hypothetical protein